jgi:hypothetical protein
VSKLFGNFFKVPKLRAFTAFLFFELALVLAPVCLLLVVLPLMIGPQFRSYGLDVVRAWWDGREWQDRGLTPFYWSSSHGKEAGGPDLIPLIPRTTYCRYIFDYWMVPTKLTFRCYMDAGWHERTALFTWSVILVLFSSSEYFATKTNYY